MFVQCVCIILQAKEREIQNLQKEIKILLVMIVMVIFIQNQLNDNSEMIKVLSVDHISIEVIDYHICNVQKEQESCDQLQNEIYDLQKEIVVKDVKIIDYHLDQGAILQQQLENTKLQIESSKLMGDLAEALLEDEQNASFEENSCNMLSKDSSYS